MLLGVVPGCRSSVGALRQRCTSGDLSACESACKKGVAGEGGCFHAGEQHREKAGLDFGSADWKSSADFYRKACDGGYADGCLFAAQAIEAPYAALDTGDATALPAMIGDAEVHARERRLETACKLGSTAGCKRLGDALIGKTTDAAKAAYDKSCKASADAAACMAARAHEVEVAEQLRLGCTHRQADSCTSLGNLLFATDPPRAIRLFASECELRGVAALAGGIGAFVRDRARQASHGIALLGAAPHAPPPPPGTPQVEGHVVSVTGEVAVVEIERALLLHRDDLTTCMATLPRQAPVTLPVRLVVDRSGDVWRATVHDVASGTVPEPIARCVAAALEELSFTEPHGDVATVDVSLARAPSPPGAAPSHS